MKFLALKVRLDKEGSTTPTTSVYTENIDSREAASTAFLSDNAVGARRIQARLSLHTWLLRFRPAAQPQG